MASPDLVDVMGDDVAVDDLVAGVDEPIRVAAGTAPDVGDPCAWRWKGPLDDLDRSGELDASDAGSEPITLLVAGVVVLQLLVGHGSSLPAKPMRASALPPHGLSSVASPLRDDRRMHRLILWDIDGTLIRSGGVGRRVIEEAATR